MIIYLVGKEHYFTFKEFKEAFFPNVPPQELEEDRTEEQIHEDLKRIVRNAKATPPKREIDSKKQPRV